MGIGESLTGVLLSDSVPSADRPAAAFHASKPRANRPVSCHIPRNPAVARYSHISLSVTGDREIC